jgi:hypothetical protein
MFKKLIPVVALALIAGPVFAADAPATTPTDQSSTATSKPHHKKHKKATSTKTTPSTDTSSAPAK